MFRYLRLRRLAVTASAGTLAALAAAMMLAAPSRASNPEKVYSARFDVACIVGIGALNIKAPLSVETSARGPAEVAAGEEFSFHEASVKLISPKSEGIKPGLVAFAATEARGTATQFLVENTGATPLDANIARPAEFPSGLPFVAAVEGPAEEELVLDAPTEGTASAPIPRTYTFGPFRAGAGPSVRTIVSSELGWEEIGPNRYAATGDGIIFSVEGRNEHGATVLGPLETACNTPSGVVLAEIPVRNPVQTATYSNWGVSGSLTPKRLAQAIELPASSTFNGNGEVNTSTGAGSVSGTFTIPPFTAPLKLLGMLPSSVGLSITQAGALQGTVAKSETAPGDETLTLPLKLNVGVTSFAVLGLTIPTRCASEEPVSLALGDTLTSEELLSEGWSFAGTTALPRFRCQGGLLGRVFGGALSALLSGTGNAYALKVSSPG